MRGKTQINGAKNAILPILAACLLSKGECVLHNVPLLEDVFVMCDIMKHYGANIVWCGNTLVVKADDLQIQDSPTKLMKRMRASNLVLGPLICRLGEVCLTFPGGCAIGARPMDYHLIALNQLGVKVINDGSLIKAQAQKMRGGKIYFDFPSVGATENALMAASLTPGRTVIYNAAREPEISDLALFLNKMGAKITGAGSDIINIEGVSRLQGAEHAVLQDRIEAGTMMVAAAISGGDILLKDYRGNHCCAVISKLCEGGIEITEEQAGLRIKGNKRMRSVDIKTLPHPGFPTDLQAQFMALLATSQGTGIVSENIFENRFRHVSEMMRFGADIKVVGDAAIVKGKPSLTGAHVKATDLRAGAALVLLALAAHGESYVDDIHYIDRGYESFEQSLKALGADITRQSVVLNEAVDARSALYPCYT